MVATVQLHGKGGLDVRIANTVLRWTGRPALGLLSELAFIVHRLAPRFIPRLSFRFTDWIGMFLPNVRGTSVRRTSLDSCHAEWIESDDGAGGAPTILYLHGGAFIACGLRTHRRLVSRITLAVKGCALAGDYRMLPRWTVDDAVADGLDAYRRLLDRGIDPGRIIVAGDSAGAFLSASLIDRIGLEGLPPPAGMVFISGITTFDNVDRALYAGRTRDSLFPARSFACAADVLASQGGRRALPKSLVDLDLAQFPPVLIQVGSEEIFLDECRVFAGALAAAGVPVTLQIWNRAPHVFQVGADVLPDAKQAIAEIATFIALAADTERSKAA